MFGISILIIVLVVSLGVTFKHGRYNFGQILFGVFLGLLLTGIFPTLAPAVRSATDGVGHALQNFSIK